MAKVADKTALLRSRPLFICDFSPPRGADPAWPEEAKGLDADFLCLAYNPGRSVRVDPAMAAHIIKERYDKEVVFVLACRDMNRLAIQTHLLGASALGLENVVVLKGDAFSPQETSQTGDVAGFRPTELIRAIKAMNQGLDYKGRQLERPTSYCVGAAIDPARELEAEARLARKKALAGADFFLTQPVYDAQAATRLLDSVGSFSDTTPAPSMFFGVQVLQPGGVEFSRVPQAIRNDLQRGRPGAEVALEVIHHLLGVGIDTIYLIPPVGKGGVRDYPAAQRVLSAFR
ncbi:MAG: methylenetetrahydrofolate reductase [Dehalococcoidia bacterium]